MSLNKSVLLIRDYNNIRQILRDIYIFGCFSRDDFIEKGIGARKYDNEQRRISAYLPEHFIKKRRQDKRVLLYCTYDMEDTSKNYLAETYRNKSFTLLDIMAYFFVLQYLSDGASKTLPEMLDEENGLPNFNEERMFTKDNLRVKLDELVADGLICSEKKGKKVFYRLSEDIWKDFSDEELEDIYLYLDFLKNSSPIEMPFYFLQKKLGLYIESNRNINISDATILQFKHSHIFNSLDNDVLIDILRGINSAKTIRIVREGRDGNYEIVVSPVTVIHDSTYGRQYLIYLGENETTFSAVRLDKIVSVEPSRDLTMDEQKLIDEHKEIINTCWCTSGLDKDLTDVRIRFLINEEREKYIFRRIENEGHGGTLEKIKDGEYLYRVSLRDPMEMVPWLRSFGERAIVISSGSFPLKETIYNDWERAVKKYEALS